MMGGIPEYRRIAWYVECISRVCRYPCCIMRRPLTGGACAWCVQFMSGAYQEEVPNNPITSFLLGSSTPSCRHPIQHTSCDKPQFGSSQQQHPES